MKNGGDTYRMGHIIMNDWEKQSKMDDKLKEYDVWSKCKKRLLNLTNFYLNNFLKSV